MLFRNRKKSQDYYKEKALWVLAQVFVEQLTFDSGYPEEWSGSPLSGLVTELCTLLDQHPAKLGTKIQAAYSRTYPAIKSHNVMHLRDDFPEYFGDSKDSYLARYEVQKNSGKIVRLKSDTAQKDLMIKVAADIWKVQAALTDKQENEYRSLFKITQALFALYKMYEPKISAVGFSLQEYADWFFDMPQTEKKKFAIRIADEVGIRLYE